MLCVMNSELGQLRSVRYQLASLQLTPARKLKRIENSKLSTELALSASNFWQRLGLLSGKHCAD